MFVNIQREYICNVVLDLSFFINVVHYVLVHHSDFEHIIEC